ncbi:response regulator transcription factor [Amycolatopsis sp. cmx-11-51]|uniref:response regulator transcription factor n=1 Tax=unclassified Amycolatopsis TaxID=2618356 RepID=UPI0039E33381
MREIAGLLHLSHRTVERHVSSLIAKTGLPGRIELGRFAATAGILRITPATGSSADSARRSIFPLTVSGSVSRWTQRRGTICGGTWVRQPPAHGGRARIRTGVVPGQLVVGAGRSPNCWN